ncbi:hypothetical protein EON64_04705 [archaeon]|nr:MAG: hypothetical protein EON64_04705 [archaeon]
MRKLDVQFDYDRFLRHTVLNGDSSVKHQEKKRGEYFAKFEMAKKVLGLELNVDTLLRDRATLLFDPSVCAQADAARLLFEQRLHHTAHKNNAHHLAAALLLVVGIAKVYRLLSLQ